MISANAVVVHIGFLYIFSFFIATRTKLYVYCLQHDSDVREQKILKKLNDMVM